MHKGVLRILERWVDYDQVQQDIEEMDSEDSCVTGDIHQMRMISAGCRAWSDLLELLWVELLGIVLPSA